MSKLRPECGNAKPNDGTVSVPYDTALLLIRDSVLRRRSLIHGRLDGPNETHCAMGCFWADNPRITVPESLVDEVAAVNDSLGPTATPQQRWKKVNEWLRFKIQSMMTKKARTT